MQKIFSIMIVSAILFLCVDSLFAQVKNKESQKVHKAFLSENSLLRLRFESRFQSTLQFDFSPNKYVDEKNIPLPLEMLPGLFAQKNNLNKALQLQKKWLNENKLGVVGHILQYAEFAATGYLLYAHLKKYKDEYK